MSPARTRHGVTGQDRRQAHIDWLKLIEVSGPFLSVPVLTAEWPDLEPLDNKDKDRLRQEHRQWQERPAAHRDDWIATSWTTCSAGRAPSSTTTWPASPWTCPSTRPRSPRRSP